MYRQHNLRGGHIIKLGPGNDDAAKEALQAWPGMSTKLVSLLHTLLKTTFDSPNVDGMHLGGGITAENAQSWLDAGAEKVIVTSYLFPSAKFSLERLQQLSQRVGKDKLVVDVRWA